MSEASDLLVKYGYSDTEQINTDGLSFAAGIRADSLGAAQSSAIWIAFSNDMPSVTNALLSWCH